MVLFEAMAAGVPVVTTRVGGIPDVVSDLEAILVPAGDPEALARGMSELVLTDQAVRIAAGQARLSRDFSLERWLDEYEAVYRDLTRIPGMGED
jgi:glycosyltransferase involved in cell wall biosynthesis